MPRQRDAGMIKIDPFKFAVALAENKLNNKQLAEKANVAVTSITAFTTGRYSKALIVGKVAEALNVKITDIADTN